MKKLQAFTLAEVLVTLGVIGVVAAMTLPTLIQNYNKKAWTTQLQKSYSMWEQAFQKMMADDGVQRLSDTSVWAAKGVFMCYGDSFKNATNVNCINFLNGLKKYIKIIDVEEYGNKINYINGNGSEKYIAREKFLVLSDGTMVNFQTGEQTKNEVCDQIKSLGGSTCSLAALFVIDVNGQRGPNTYGRDVFQFIISDEGKLYPYGGKDYALYYEQTTIDGNTKYWRKLSDAKGGCGTPNAGINSSNRGLFCAARIIEDGWKMDY